GLRVRSAFPRLVWPARQCAPRAAPPARYGLAGRARRWAAYRPRRGACVRARHVGSDQTYQGATEENSTLYHRGHLAIPPARSRDLATETAAPSEGWSPAEETEHLQRSLDHFHSETMHLVAHSLGAMFGL